MVHFPTQIYCWRRLTQGVDYGHRQTETLRHRCLRRVLKAPRKAKVNPIPPGSSRQPPAVHERASFLSGKLLSARHPGPLTGDGRTTALTV